MCVFCYHFLAFPRLISFRQPNTAWSMQCLTPLERCYACKRAKRISTCLSNVRKVKCAAEFVSCELCVCSVPHLFGKLCYLFGRRTSYLSMPLWSELLTYFCWRDICVEQHLSAIMSAVVLCCHIFSIDYTPTIQHGPVWLGNFSVLRVKEMLTAIGVNFGGQPWHVWSELASYSLLNPH